MEVGVELIADLGGLFVVLYMIIYSLNFCCTCKCYKNYVFERVGLLTDAQGEPLPGVEDDSSDDGTYAY